jgi:hypothetical protein
LEDEASAGKKEEKLRNTPVSICVMDGSTTVHRSCEIWQRPFLKRFSYTIIVLTCANLYG